MSCSGSGRWRWAVGSSARWPSVFAKLLLLQVVLLLVVDTRTALSLKFPLPPLVPRWFYNGTYASPLCETTFRCDSSSRNLTLPACSCHPNCSLYDACCEDVRHSDWRRRTLPSDAYKCAVYPLFGTDNTGNVVTVNAASFVFLITKCPSTYSVHIVAKLCAEQLSNSSSTKESWVSDNTTGVTYRNQFCAFCYGVPASRMIFWNSSNTCINESSLEKFGLNGCKHNVILLNSFEIPKCTGPYIASCPNEAKLEMKDACAGSPARYIYDHTNFLTYRNYNCSVCASHRDSMPIEQCTPYSAPGFAVKLDLQGLLGFDVCPKKLLTFATKDDQDVFSQLCPDTLFDTENCSETVNKTTFLASYASDANLEYRITPTGVRLLLNDTYSVCYRCQLNVTYNYALQENNVTTLNDTYPKPLYQVGINGSVTVCSAPKPIEDSLLQPCTAVPQEVSIVLMSLSLLGLAMYAVAYAVLPSLRNLPGQIVLHQSAAFFAAFLLWLLQTQAPPSSEACVALGVFIHFFFIAAFTWTTVYAVEVVRALGFQAYGAGYTKRRMRYTVVGWLVPVIIMTFAIGVNWAPPDMVDLRYRPAYGKLQCFIVNPVALRIFFTAPLAAFLLIDVVIYGYVIVQLVVISGQTKLVRDSHHEKLVLAVKLVFALGLTWIFAVLATATANCNLGYIFTVLNSLQGVFLFLIFICNAKTSGQIHQKVRGQKSLTSVIATGITVSSRESSSSTSSIMSRRKSVLGVKSFSPVSLAMGAREHATKPPR